DPLAHRLSLRCPAPPGREHPRRRLQHAGADRRPDADRPHRVDVRAGGRPGRARSSLARGGAGERHDRRHRRLAPPRRADRPANQADRLAIRPSRPGRQRAGLPRQARRPPARGLAGAELRRASLRPARLTRSVRGDSSRGSGVRRAVLVAIAAFVVAPAAARADVQPYGTNDAGGFRNVLPAGEAGTDNAAQFAQFQATGQRPAHWDDQLPLYTDLLYASPSLTNADIPRFYKDATFGTPSADVESTESPRPGVTIVRDKPFGVPHIYGNTAADVEFGAG